VDYLNEAPNKTGTHKEEKENKEHAQTQVQSFTFFTKLKDILPRI
jgi:hypothetical protein